VLEAINCYFTCIARSSTNFILFSLLMVTLGLGVIFLFSRRPYHMFFSQFVSSIAIIEGFRQMSCPMGGQVWGYFGIVLGGVAFLGVVQVAFDRYVKNFEITDARFLRNLSSDLGADIFLLDTQKVKAFTHRRRIYLSVGLVELLEPDEIKAVAAHELYHARHTPNRVLANILAVSSLWFRSFRDETEADRFAAGLVGSAPLSSALQKLGVKGQKKRINRIASRN
jgi:heat shock protein HtpX